jgi:hypothetical protein
VPVGSPAARIKDAVATVEQIRNRNASFLRIGFV